MTDQNRLQLVKNLKELGKYSEGEIISAAPSNSAETIAALKWTENVLQSVARVKRVQGPRVVSLPTENDTFKKVLNDIKKNLAAYEEKGPGTHDFAVEWQTGKQDFSQVSFEQAMEYVKQLRNYLDNAEMVSLLAKKKLGEVYSWFYGCIVHGEWQGLTWDSFCKQYLGSARTANRYIDLYNLLSAYPRLAVCKLAMETILRFSELLLVELKQDYNLACGLAVPLFETKIWLGLDVVEENVSATPDSMTLLSEKNNMQGGWAAEDEIVDELLN